VAAICRSVRGRGDRPAAELDAALDRISAMNIETLRALWRERMGQGPPESFSKDLIARALAYQIQEEHLGGLDRRTRKLLAPLGKPDEKPPRRLKIGSIIVREYQGVTHEVLVVPGGFCWQRQTYASLSTIAKEITGTSWNGPRFFGLKNDFEPINNISPGMVDTRRQAEKTPRSPVSRRRSVVIAADGRRQHSFDGKKVL
jgi:Protein of unknown function (DUF2924)